MQESVRSVFAMLPELAIMMKMMIVPMCFRALLVASSHLLQLYSKHDLVSSFSSGPPVLRPTAVQYTKAVYVLTLRTGTLQAGRIGSRLRKMGRTMRRNAS